jgi:hypothetical protein
VDPAVFGLGVYARNSAELLKLAQHVDPADLVALRRVSAGANLAAPIEDGSRATAEKLVDMYGESAGNTLANLQAADRAIKGLLQFL